MLCNGFTKLSLLTFYLNLSPEGWFRVSVWVVIALVSANTIVITFLFFFQCDPPRMIWTVRHQGGSCMNAAVLYIATAASNVVTDFILFVMPLPMVLSLRLRVMQKVGAVIVFAIASMTFATSIGRATPASHSTTRTLLTGDSPVGALAAASEFARCTL
jgi:hypothetical protein